MNTLFLSPDRADVVLDAVLRAAGSGLRHYTMPGAREQLRATLDGALRAVLHAPPAGTRDDLGRVLVDAVQAGITLRGELEAGTLAADAYAEAIRANVQRLDLRLRALTRPFDRQDTPHVSTGAAILDTASRA